MQAKLKDILTEYKELNSNSLYEPVAIGKYGLRKRDEIYKKDISSDYSKNKVIRKNTLTIGMGSNQIDIGVLFDDEIYSVSPAYHTFSIDANVIEPKYLDLMLKTKNSYYFKKHSIVTVRQGKKINLDSLFNEEIDIPSFEKQAQIIDKIKEISNEIYNEKVNIAYLDTFIKSRFIEIFGDPVENPYNWNLTTINDVCSSIVRGPFGSTLKKEYFVPKSDKTIKVYEQQHAIKKNDKLGTYYVTEEKYNSLKRFECKSGDILMSCSGTMGELYQLPDGCEKGIINQALCKFTLNDKMLPIVFLESMKYVVKQMDKKGSAIQNIAAVSYVKAMKMCLPPIDVQEKFASFVELIDKLKFNAQERIKLYQELLDKKMDEYFN